MTHPENPEVGGANDEPVVAAEPTLEDRFAALAEEQDEEPQPEAADDAEPELTEEDVAEDEEAEASDEEDPPIQPPASLTAEEKEAFKNWPRDAQEFAQRRIGELEKGFHTKAQEAKQARSQVEQEATNHILQMQEQYAQQLQALMPQVPAKPSHLLQADDPWAYAEQMDAYERAVAQYGYVQQQLQAIGSRTEQARQAMRNQALQETEAVLKEQFPEYLDAEQGPKLRQELGSIALELGYTAEQLADVDARDILAMKRANEWKAKAAKYDALMSKKMEKVREARGMPKVSKPGVPQGKGAVASQRYTADRQAMKQGDPDAAKRVFARFL